MKPLGSTWFEVAGLLAGRFFQIWTFIGVQNIKITFSFPNTNYFSLLSSTTTFSRALYQRTKKKGGNLLFFSCSLTCLQRNVSPHYMVPQTQNIFLINFMKKTYDSKCTSGKISKCSFTCSYKKKLAFIFLIKREV